VAGNFAFSAACELTMFCGKFCFQFLMEYYSPQLIMANPLRELVSVAKVRLAVHQIGSEIN
jgi:hypothetical protein